MLRKFLWILFFFSTTSNASDWEERSPQDDIVSVLSSDSNAGWVITASLDIDGDGDKDELVCHAYLNSQGKETDHAKCFVYFNEGGRYYFSKTESYFSIYYENMEFRKLANTSGARALVKYETNDYGHDRIVAMWYERPGGIETLKRRQSFFPVSSLLPPDDVDIVSEKIPEKWSDRGLSIDHVLDNYRRLELNEARLEFRVTE